MSTAEQLVNLMYTWMRKRRRCAELLNKLAEELELLREKCNAGETVGNTSAVIGSALMIGAGVATVCTGGAAAPLLGLGAAFSGGGLAISVGTGLTENILSGKTMEEAQRIERQSNAAAEELQRLFQQLRLEVVLANPGADPDEVDRLVIAEILRVLAPRRGLLTQINIQVINNEPQIFMVGDMGTRQLLRPEVVLGFFGILSFFAFGLNSHQFNRLCADGAGTLVSLLSKTAAKTTRKLLKMSRSGPSAGALTSTGFKAALCGGTMIVGGAAGLAFTLPEATANWKKLIEGNHVTEASQSLRDTAEALLETSGVLRNQLRTMSVEMDGLAQAVNGPEPEPGP